MNIEKKKKGEGESMRHFIAEKNLTQEDWEIMHESLKEIHDDKTNYTKPVILARDLKICFPGKGAELQIDEQFLRNSRHKLEAWIQINDFSEHADWREVLELATAILDLFPEINPNDLIDEEHWGKIKEIESVYKNRILLGIEEKSQTQTSEIDFLQKVSMPGGFFNNYLEIATARKILRLNEELFQNQQEEDRICQFGLNKLKQIEDGGVFWDDYAGVVIQVITLFPKKISANIISEEAWMGMQQYLQAKRGNPMAKNFLARNPNPIYLASIARKMEIISGTLETRKQ